MIAGKKVNDKVNEYCRLRDRQNAVYANCAKANELTVNELFVLDILWFANDGITVNVIGTEKVVADYYEHQTGHHMVKACAVFNYSGKTVLKSGLFESNNICVMAYGGEVIIDGGDIHNTV